MWVHFLATSQAIGVVMLCLSAAFMAKELPGLFVTTALSVIFTCGATIFGLMTKESAYKRKLFLFTAYCLCAGFELYYVIIAASMHHISDDTDMDSLEIMGATVCFVILVLVGIASMVSSGALVMQLSEKYVDIGEEDKRIFRKRRLLVAAVLAVVATLFYFNPWWLLLMTLPAFVCLGVAMWATYWNRTAGYLAAYSLLWMFEFLMFVFLLSLDVKQWNHILGTLCLAALVLCVPFILKTCFRAIFVVEVKATGTAARETSDGRGGNAQPDGEEMVEGMLSNQPRSEDV